MLLRKRTPKKSLYIKIENFTLKCLVVRLAQNRFVNPTILIQTKRLHFHQTKVHIYFVNSVTCSFSLLEKESLQFIVRFHYFFPPPPFLTFTFSPYFL